MANINLPPIPGGIRQFFREIGGMDLIRNAGHDAQTLSIPQRSIRLAITAYYRDIGFYHDSLHNPTNTVDETSGTSLTVGQRITRVFTDSVSHIYDTLASTERNLMAPWNFGGERTPQDVARDIRWAGATILLYLTKALPANGGLGFPYKYDESTATDALFVARDCIAESIKRSNALEGIDQDEGAARTEAFRLARKVFDARGDYLAQREVLEQFVNRERPVRRNLFTSPN